MVARFLELKGDEDWKNFASVAHTIMVARKQQDADNELDEQEQQNFKELDYFKTLFEKKEEPDINNKNQYYRYLLLALIAWQPALRTNFYTTAKFITSEKDDNGTDNYILVKKVNQLRTDVTFIVNNDKVSNSKYYKQHPELSFIKVENKQLIKIIEKVFENYKTTYLFGNAKVSDEKILKMLRDVTFVPGLTMRNLRTAWVVYGHSTFKTHKEKTALATAMRHSVEVASLSYNKNLHKEVPKTDAELQKRVEELQQKLTQLEIENNSLKLKLSNQGIQIDDGKPNEDVIANKYFEKRRRDVLWNINSKGRVPNQATIEKYKLKKDNNGKYSWWYFLLPILLFLPIFLLVVSKALLDIVIASILYQFKKKDRKWNS